MVFGSPAVPVFSRRTVGFAPLDFSRFAFLGTVYAVVNFTLITVCSYPILLIELFVNTYTWKRAWWNLRVAYYHWVSTARTLIAQTIMGFSLLHSHSNLPLNARNSMKLAPWVAKQPSIFQAQALATGNGGFVRRVVWYNAPCLIWQNTHRYNDGRFVYFNLYRWNKSSLPILSHLLKLSIVYMVRLRYLTFKHRFNKLMFMV